MRLDNCVKARFSLVSTSHVLFATSCRFSLKVVSTVWLVKIRHETHLEGRALLPEIYQRLRVGFPALDRLRVHP